MAWDVIRVGPQLRKTVATNMAEVGVGVEAGSRMLGHSEAVHKKNYCQPIAEVSTVAATVGSLWAGVAAWEAAQEKLASGD
jgi:hypothetical protein